MLFTNWRNENELLNDAAVNKKKYEEKIGTVKINRRKYIKNDQIENEIEDALNNIQNADDQELEEQENDEANDVIPEFAIYETNNNMNADIGLELNQASDEIIIQNMTIVRQIPSNEYYKLICNLNDKQYRYHLNFIHTMRNSRDVPVYHFINGSAGVGKSMLIKALTQSVLRYCNSIPGSNPENIYVLLCAICDKAAFNISGVTLHSAFHLPFEGNKMNFLEPDTLNTLSTKLTKLEYIFIDEVSMFDSKYFHGINKRLNEIFCNEELFQVMEH